MQLQLLYRPVWIRSRFTALTKDGYCHIACLMSRPKWFLQPCLSHNGFFNELWIFILFSSGCILYTVCEWITLSSYWLALPLPSINAFSKHPLCFQMLCQQPKSDQSSSKREGYALSDDLEQITQFILFIDSRRLERVNSTVASLSPVFISIFRTVYYCGVLDTQDLSHKHCYLMVC